MTSIWTEIGIPGGVIILLVGILGFVMRAIVKGDLVSRKVHEEIRLDRDAWRNAATTSDARADEMVRQINPVIEGVKTVVQVLESIKGASNAR